VPRCGAVDGDAVGPWCGAVDGDAATTHPPATTPDRAVMVGTQRTGRRGRSGSHRWGNPGLIADQQHPACSRPGTYHRGRTRVRTRPESANGARTRRTL